MSVPSDLTATLIVTEAFNKVGESNPTSSEITRAEAYALRGVISSIYTELTMGGSVKLRMLQAVDVQPTIINQSKYSVPSDFDEEVILSILEGDDTGKATAGASTTITLSGTHTDVEGNYIFITSGTGVNGLRQVIDYDSTTKVATVDTAWSTNPDATSGYLIATTETELDRENVKLAGALSLNDVGEPTTYMKIREGASEYFIFDKPAGAVYGLILRYYVDPNKLDLTSATMTKIYNEWMNALIFGVALQVAVDDDDTKDTKLSRLYEREVQKLIEKESPAMTEINEL
jgi:hypothetical protein